MMHFSALNEPVNYTSIQLDTVSIEAARTWIGCSLTLKKPLLGFEAGTRCVVMCVVDFGDGFLLWICTNERHSRDIDQLDISEITDYFTVGNSDCASELTNSDKLANALLAI